MGNNNEEATVAGPSRLTMAPPIISTSSQPEYESYWQSANRAAEPIQSTIRRRLPHFPSPPLRIQRVSQLDAEILDTELTSMLMEPLKVALRNIKSTLPQTLEPEMLLVLRLILYKFSIYERGTTYGAMLQNLRYRNEWAHSGGLQSTSRDAPLSRLQLTLYPALTILFPYLHNKVERRMSHLSYSDMPSNDPRRLLWNTMDQLQRTYSALTLANFLAFLSDGRYRTLTDRVLGMRLTYAERTMSRNVSFEFLNRQLVWHAFTEFLLFLLPLVRPRKLLRRLLRIPTHPLLLSFWLTILPKAISSKAGLYRDDKGKAKIKLAFLTSKKANNTAEGNDAKYPDLPEDVCAICWEKLEDQAGIKSSGQSMIRSGIPSSDPLDPSASALAPSARTVNQHQQSSSPTTTSSSSSGLVYADAQIHTPYQAKPCGHQYCYVCLVGKLLSEEAAEDIAETTEDGEEPSAWTCLRCGKGVKSAEREESDVVLDIVKKGKEK